MGAPLLECLCVVSWDVALAGIYLKLYIFCKTRNTKSSFSHMAVVQPASPNMPLIADVRTPTPWRTRPGLSRATPFNAARLDAPPPSLPASSAAFFARFAPGILV